MRRVGWIGENGAEGRYSRRILVESSSVTLIRVVVVAIIQSTGGASVAVPVAVVVAVVVAVTPVIVCTTVIAVFVVARRTVVTVTVVDAVAGDPVGASVAGLISAFRIVTRVAMMQGTPFRRPSATTIKLSTGPTVRCAMAKFFTTKTPLPG